VQLWRNFNKLNLAYLFNLPFKLERMTNCTHMRYMVPTIATLCQLLLVVKVVDWATGMIYYE
jgi:hypothetical protein